MPTYDYVCAKCAHAFEAFQPMRDDPLVKCPKCGRKSLKRRPGGGAGLIFKGSGFYQTDYKNGKSSAEAKTGGAETPAKPAAKPAAAAAGAK